jgi:hypothetical protein
MNPFPYSTGLIMPGAEWRLRRLQTGPIQSPTAGVVAATAGHK